MADDLVPIDKDQVKLQGADLLTFASAVAIQDEATWREARERRQLAKELDKKADTFFKKLKQPHDVAKKAILDGEKEIRGPLQAALEYFDPKILEFEEDFFKRQRPELQRMLQEQAREKADNERIEQIKDLEKAGDLKAADELRAQPLYVPSIVLPEYDGWLKGESRLDNWTIDDEHINMEELVLAVASGKVPIAALEPNTTFLRNMAKALKDTFDIPGVNAVEKVTMKQT